MGWLDRFLGRGGDAKGNRESPERALVELVFESAGGFEIARCPGAQALAQLQRWRQVGRTDGFTAILLGDDDDAEMLAENRAQREGDIGQLIEAAAEFDVDAWLQQQRVEDSESEVRDEGDWPDEPPPPGEISAHRDILTGEPLPKVCLARIPTPNSWEAPIHVGMGGWNECPESIALAAFARRWQLRYGAEVVSITHDVMEFAVSDPPSTREAAWELAREQYLFCADIVDQGHGSVASLAAALLNSDYWYFWWD